MTWGTLISAQGHLRNRCRCAFRPLEKDSSIVLPFPHARRAAALFLRACNQSRALRREKVSVISATSVWREFGVRGPGFELSERLAEICPSLKLMS